MSNLLLVLLTTFSLGDNAINDVKAIEKVVTEFAKAGDDRDLDALMNLTSVNYRIVMNQLFGSTDLSIMDRTTYLDMIKQEKFGGDTRQIEIHTTVISGNNAIVDATFTGQAMKIRSLISLSKNSTGEWKLLCETPTVL